MKMRGHYLRSLVIFTITCLVLHFPTGHPLYEDQIGVFDWTQKLIGNVIFVEQNLLSASGLYFFGSERNVIAAVFAENGSIAWRHVLENDGILKSLILCERTLISFSSVPNIMVRAWQANSGSIIWEKIFEGTESPVCQCGSVPNTLFCSAENTLFVMNIHTGKVIRFDEPVPSGNITTVHFVSPTYKLNDTHQAITIFGAEPSRTDLTKVTMIFATDAMTQARVLEKSSIPTPRHWGRDFKNCVTACSSSDATQMFLICLFPDDERGNVLASLPLNGHTSEWLSIHVTKGASRLQRLAQNSFSLSSGSGAVYGVNSSGILFVKFPLPQAAITSLSTFNNRDYLFVGHQEPNSPMDNFQLTVYDLNSGESVSDFAAQRWTVAKHYGAVEAIYASVFRNPDRSLGFRVLLKTEDHTIQLLRENSQLVWLREESLADIVAVELVDLPVSESQAHMEEEFGHIHRNLLEMFVIRLRTQATQLVAFFKSSLIKFLQLLDEVILSYTTNSFGSTDVHSAVDHPSSSSSGNHTTHTPAFTFPPRLIRGLPPVTNGQPSDVTPSFLTRDTFNLHKMIVIATAVGKVFGLESEKGRVVWEYLVPDATLLANGKLALFQQRNTAHFPLPPIATLLLRSKRTNLPVLFSFNPITGIPLERSGDSVLPFPTDIIQAVLLPGPVGEHTDFMRPILLLDVNAKVHTYPPEYNQTWRSEVSPLYLYTVEPASGRLTGYQVHSSMSTSSEELASTSRVWRMYLQSPVSNDSQAIVALAARPAAEHIHSVGRVLGDRSVLYKYLNPNLIAVITASTVGAGAGPVANSLTLYLIDVVAGRVVYSSVHRRCSAPVTLVFSENWILYTYYNHKSLRYEATVLELFESTAGGEPCAAYSVPTPIQLFLQNLLPTGWFSVGSQPQQPPSQQQQQNQKQHGAESSGRLGHRGLQHAGSRAVFSSLYRTTTVDGICRSTGVSSLIPWVLQQSYIFTTAPIHGASAVSLTERGITSKSIIFGLQKGALIELPKALFDPRRQIDLTPELAEEGVHPYAPVLPLSDQAIISYNHSVMGIRAIRTAMTGLESTSLVFAYGLDMFFTRIAPSLTYDLLKEDFDYTAIATVTLGMVVASVVTQRLAARGTLFRSWA